MLDIRILRNFPDVIKKSIVDRGGRYLEALDQLLEKDRLWRDTLKEVEELRNKRNEIAKNISSYKIRKEDPPKDLSDAARDIKNRISEKEETLKTLESEVSLLLLGLPNILDASVPIGKSEEENRLVYEDVSNRKKFEFKPLAHWVGKHGFSISKRPMVVLRNSNTFAIP